MTDEGMVVPSGRAESIATINKGMTELSDRQLNLLAMFIIEAQRLANYEKLVERIAAISEGRYI